MECTDLNPFNDDDTVEPCRTCGIYFISSHEVIQPIFKQSGAGENCNGNMQEIVQQMNAWNLEVDMNDGRPQYMCISCIGEFQKVLRFKRNCLETQDQFNELDYKRMHNGIVIKKEIEPQNDEEKFCGFIYLDTDEEEEGSEEDGSRRVCAPLDIPHVPIKEEHTARVPQEKEQYEPSPSVPIVSDLHEEATFAQVKPDVLAAANGFSSTLFEPSTQVNAEEDIDDEIIKFTYEDDEDGESAVTMLPAPIEEPGVYCKLCGHASVTQTQHNEHMARIHMLKDCECHICGKKFTNAHESRLRFHMKWHKLQKHLKCPICGFFCNSKDTLKEHKLAVHTRSKCEFCGKKMKHRQLQAHLNRHIQEREEELARKLESTIERSVTTPPVFIQCAFCEYTFDEAEDLQTHVLTMHRTQAKLPDEPAQLQAIDASILTGQAETVEASPINEILTTQDTADTSQHSGSNQRHNKSICECNICGKTFDLKIKLNRHLKLHTKAPF